MDLLYYSTYFKGYWNGPLKGQKARANSKGHSGLKKANYLEFGLK